ncbi:TPA: hypothetical protein ACXN34_005911 [Burkholderia cepacia]|uniref:GIY-YIG nuclease family protein n=1 Tax=Burkholderia cepacia TaxID=292 RepID=UPI00158BE74E|nr:GIY-YIG nuclease family protein [Burkholderia cepacia]
MLFLCSDANVVEWPSNVVGTLITKRVVDIGAYDIPGKREMARKSDLVERAEEWVGCYTIYACRFSSGLTKVGLSSDLPKRIASHWGHGLTGLQSFHACEASSEAHMRDAERAAHALWGRPINQKDSREVFETRGTAADDLKRLQRAIDDTSPAGWKRRVRRRWWGRLARRVLFLIVVVAIILVAVGRRPRPDVHQQAAPAVPESASVPVQDGEVLAPTQADRLTAAKALIDARIAEANIECSESGSGSLSVHINFDAIGAATSIELVRSSGDLNFDSCKLDTIRKATRRLLYMNGRPFEGDVIYTINGAASTLEAASAPLAPAVAPESGLSLEAEQFVATHIVTADCDSRASCLVLYAKTIAAANAAQPASAAP